MESDDWPGAVNAVSVQCLWDQEQEEEKSTSGIEKRGQEDEEIIGT